MQMQNHQKANNRVKKKSHVLLIGSFLVFIGIISLLWNYFLKMRDEVYSDMRIAMMDEEVVEEPVEVTGDVQIENPVTDNQDTNTKNYIVDYSKYLGVLEIPKIGLKRGFYNVGNKYNNIQFMPN